MTAEHPDTEATDVSDADIDIADEHLGDHPESAAVPPDEESAGTPVRRRLSDVGWATTAGLLALAAVLGLVGWLGYRAYGTRQADEQHELFVQAARQGAVNLTTISYTEIDTDVQRILDSATGSFRDDFEKRAKPFVDIVKQAQSKSEGEVTEAAVESEQADSAQVLVAVNVKTQNGAGEQEPREWRMRIDVRKVGDGAKVSNVEFVA